MYTFPFSYTWLWSFCDADWRNDLPPGWTHPLAARHLCWFDRAPGHCNDSQPDDLSNWMVYQDESLWVWNEKKARILQEIRVCLILDCNVLRLTYAHIMCIHMQVNITNIHCYMSISWHVHKYIQHVHTRRIMQTYYTKIYMLYIQHYEYEYIYIYNYTYKHKQNK